MCVRPQNAEIIVLMCEERVPCTKFEYENLAGAEWMERTRCCHGSIAGMLEGDNRKAKAVASLVGVRLEYSGIIVFICVALDVFRMPVKTV